MRADAEAEADRRERALLVGRGPELLGAREALQSAGSVLLRGPAGIGRSALSAVLAAEAAAGGAVVLRCAPSGEERVLPYVGLVDLFAELPEQRLDALLDGLPQGQRAALGDALLRGRSPGSGVDRLALRVGVLQVLRVLAAEAAAGLLVVLDGLQWLDGPSAEVLRFVLRRTGRRRLGVRLLATERTGWTEWAEQAEPAGATGVGQEDGRPRLRLREVCPADTVELVLPPLRPAAVAELLVRDCGGPLPADVLRDVQQVAAGNPGYALDLARAGFRLGADGTGPVPWRLRELVLDRLPGLSGAERKALLLAAAASRPTVAELREALGGQDPLLLLASALCSGLVALVGPGEAGQQAGRQVGRVGFADPLVPVVLLAQAAPAELTAARRSLAAVAADPGERARLRALSHPGEPEETTAAALADAAARARRSGAVVEAYRLAHLAARHTPVLATSQGVGVVEPVDPADPADPVDPSDLGSGEIRADRLLMAAQYAYDAGRWQEARALAAELLEVTTPSQALSARTRAGALLIRSSGQELGTADELIATATATATAIAPAPAPATAGRRPPGPDGVWSDSGWSGGRAEDDAVLRRRSAERALSAGRIAQAGEEAAAAVDLAGSVGDAAGQAAALGVLSTVQALRGELGGARRTLAAGLTAGAAVRGWGRHPVRWELQRRQAAADLDADRTSAALTRLASLTRGAGDGIGLTDLAESLILRIRVEATAGDGVAAMASAARLGDLLAELGAQPEATARAIAGSVATVTWRDAGIADGMEAASTVAPAAVGAGPVLHAWALAELAGGSGLRAGELAAYAVIASAADGDRVHQVRALGVVGAAHLLAGNAAAVAAGAEALQEARRLADRLGMADPDSARRLALLAESLVALGEYGEATRALAEARVLERGWGEGFSGRARAAVDRAEGLAQAGLGNTLQAVFLLRGAADRLRGARLPLEAAWTLMALGSVERRARHRAVARAALVQAREICLEQQAFPLLGRVERELERLEHSGAGPGADGARLTASEHRVAGLAADGATNREVAAALYVSVKTVEGTLSRVYRKLGVRSRAGLARALAAQG
ncbi:DNA-binding CsgD family transcriptional regulator [Kitasatospora sp. MAP12-15]|uniref:helix-turn-helix transcriptional regulator n=1 Tax=unclassified Kitasatospora TaxID=2633591 RepID=UPI002473C20B|nr:LuxR family transcriptional regulator [Kitasatospora sp. MAP12-44]MDH6112423.1 DNA-binding CsgD family transcriptional regulator [Kitasatospora sp. MAP12-44]